uniref:Uncharacterized protein n=1 Tax=Setaria viridis TaxID=4556 RepID=A0A4U6VPE5_SETVI|nr:hypothetical protein SEVIR_2G025100v2 [Setaria viridis]
MPESHASHHSLAGHTPPQQCKAMGCRSRFALGPCRCSHARPCGTAIIAAVACGPTSRRCYIGFLFGCVRACVCVKEIGGSLAVGSDRPPLVAAHGQRGLGGVRPPSRSQGQCKGLSLFSTLLAI